MEFIGRFLNRPSGSFFLFGPRGTGKSLWTQYSFKKAIRLDFLQPDIFRRYSGYPERFRELVEGNPQTKIFILDEVQKVVEILSVVHSLIEKYKDKQFILTGSSARKIKRKGVDLLAGRATLYNFHSFMAQELGNSFSFKKSLHYGLIPLVWMSENPKDTLGAYCGLYLKEEVQMEALVRNIGNFSRFLEAISFSYASVLNISNVARECGVGRKTVEGYIDILEDLLLSFRIEVFRKRTKRALVGHPKFYFFDVGVFRSLRPKGPFDRIEELDGLSLEGLVAQHLRAWISYRRKNNVLYYWRTCSGVEVDFVVYGEDGLWAIEVKNTSKVNSVDLRALKSFREDYPETKAIFLYRGKDRLMKEGILCIPCEEFLLNLYPQEKLFSVGVPRKN